MQLSRFEMMNFLSPLAAEDPKQSVEINQGTANRVYSCTSLRPFFHQKADWIKSFPSSSYVMQSWILQ